MLTHRIQDGVGVPRRFGMRTMAVFMVLFAGLFALLKVIETPIAIGIFLAAYLIALGIGQAWLMDGRDPRRSSIFVGMSFVPIVGTAFIGFLRPQIDDVFFLPYLSIPIGAASGYVFGTILAGVFLVFRDGVAPEAKPGGKPDQVE